MLKLKHWSGISGIFARKHAPVLGFHKFNGIFLACLPSNFAAAFRESVSGRVMQQAQ
jgi:hypothetical protein